ncbi:MAG: histidine phosphatase family protein [Aliidongia sp.]
MKHLTLIRHAKAVDASEGGQDHERGLRERGRMAAAELGRHLAVAPPALILCSTATRTRETVAYAVASWPRLPVIRYLPGLYLASAGGLLRQIEQIEPTFETVWLVGHNPGLHELALQLARHAAGAERFPELAQRFPTAARARFAIDADRWQDLGQARLTLLEFVVPGAA